MAKAPTRKRQPTKAATQKVGTYNLISAFPGYNARTDKTLVPPGTLIPGSQNVLIKPSGRIASINGYILDGTGSAAADSGILSNFDFNNFKGDTRNLRAGFLSSAGNDGKLQYRYLTGSTVNWVDLKTGLSNVRLSYTEYWDTTNLVKQCLWVDGTNNIFSWNGAVTTLASATALIAGVISTVNATPTAAGTGYVVGDILTISGGTLGTVKVTAVGGGGAVTTVALYEPGTGGYSVASGTATTGGTGTGCTVNITAVATLASITKQGTNTWAQEGFQQASGSITIGGVTATYTGQGSSTVLMGVNSDFSASAAGSIVHQTPITTTLASMSGILNTFGPTLIGCGRNNQVYVGAKNSNSLYISRVNNFKDYTFTTPTRLVGEGNLIPLDAPPTAFTPLENRVDVSSLDMYISEGANRWAVIRSTLSADLTSEKLEHLRLKVAPLQGALSQKLVGKMKNHIIFISNDNVANFLGYLSYQNVPELVDFSWTILDDMKSYDFTDASIYYNQNYIYLAIPKAGVIRIFNMTNQTQETTSSIRGVEDVDASQPWFWEAPITFPLSGFYWTTDKGLCGHSAASSESYQLFTSGSLNGQNIDAKVVFGYQDYGDRTEGKGSDELWVEGYIKQNTTLQATITGDLDAFATSQTVTINGADNTIVAFGGNQNGIGKAPLGSQPLGGTGMGTGTGTSSWFKVIKTYPQTRSTVENVAFETNGVDFGWELIAYGTNAKFTAEGNSIIRQ